jgi:hypothetical protein
VRTLFRHAVSSLLIVAASNASAGVITQDGVVFTSSFSGNVLKLQIDAAGRAGGWAGASAIDALGIKTIGSFGSVSMTSSTGARWTLSSAELNPSGCAGNEKGKSKAEGGRLCFSGGAVDLADDMLFTFVFEGAPNLGAPHLKVHFVDARGAKVGSLLSMDFPWQGETIATPAPAPAPAPEPVPSPVQLPAPAPASGVQQGGGTNETQNGGVTSPPAPLDPGLMPSSGIPAPGGDAAPGGDLPAEAPAESQSGEVPEPQSLAIVGAGLAVMGLTRRRRRPN